MRSSLLLIAVLAGTMLPGQTVENEKPYKVGGSVSPPRIISKVDPEYTPEALKARLEGRVLLQLVVTRDGDSSDVHVLRPLGLGLDEKAIQAVQLWRFKPGEKSGKPVPVEVALEVNFRLPH
jgi:periplasmic protein TonB